MNVVIITCYHPVTETRGSRISVRVFLPGRGVVRRFYPYGRHESGNPHEACAREFAQEFFPGEALEEIRLPIDGSRATGNAYLVRVSEERTEEQPVQQTPAEARPPRWTPDRPRMRMLGA
jgi:hypothetical protein